MCVGRLYLNNDAKNNDKTPCIIDIEASGFGKGSYPVEVGFVTENHMLGCCLIKPIDSWVHWNQEAENVHGIERSLLVKSGKTLTWVAKWLNQNLHGITVYSDAWANDMSWLGKLFDEAEIVQAFKIDSILNLLTEQEKEQWTPLYHQIIAENNAERHRASADALNIQKTYHRLKMGRLGQSRV